MMIIAILNLGTWADVDGSRILLLRTRYRITYTLFSNFNMQFTIVDYLKVQLQWVT